MVNFDKVDVSFYSLSKMDVIFWRMLNKEEDFDVATVYAQKDKYSALPFSTEEKFRVCMALINKWVFKGSKFGIKDEWLYDSYIDFAEGAECKAYIEKEYKDKTKLYEAITNACAEACYYFGSDYRGDDQMQPRGEDLEFYGFKMYPFFREIGVDIGKIQATIDEDDSSIVYYDFKFNKEIEKFQKEFVKRCDNNETDNIYIIKRKEREQAKFLLYLGKYLVKCDPLASGSIGVRQGTKLICESAFNECENVTNVVLNNDLEEVGVLAFANCTSLEKITFPSGVKKIGENAMYLCKNLKSVGLPDGAVLERAVCCSCPSLSKVKLPNDLRKICEASFYYTALTEIELPDSVEEIEERAFKECDKLKKIKLPKHLKIVGDNAFENCVSLEEIEFPDEVVMIGNEALKGCKSLKKLVLGNKVRKLGDNLLEGVEHLDKIKFMDKYFVWSAVSLGKNWDDNKDYDIEFIKL